MNIKPILSNGTISNVTHHVERVIFVNGEQCVVFYDNGYYCVPINTVKVV